MRIEKCIVIDKVSYLNTDKSGVFYSISGNNVFILSKKEIRGFMDIELDIFTDIPTYILETKYSKLRCMLLGKNNTVYLGKF